MADLNDIKDINLDLPLTNFPDEIDDLESFSDANDEINAKITEYKNLIKNGNTAKAEEIYETYSLKKYIISAYFLNKIQHMIIACERAISSVKKYFSFSADAPDGTTAQPNGYIWGKFLSTGDSFKKVLLKLKDNGVYVNIFPQTTADNVLISESDDGTTVKDNLNNLNVEKMDKENPTGSGALSINRKSGETAGVNSAVVGNNCSAKGENAISFGNDCAAGGKNSIAMGDICQSLRDGSITQGKGLVANGEHQIVQGKYNTIGNYAYILGGGTSFSDTKNIFTVDWDGNAKATSFTADDDVIYNGDKSLINLDTTVNKSLIDLETSIGDNTSRLDSLETDVTSLGTEVSSFGIRITGIKLYTSEAEDIAYGEYANLSQIINLKEDEQWMFIPRGMSEYSGGLDVGTVVFGVSSETLEPVARISFKLKNIDHVNKSAHKLKIAWYFISYKTT